MIVAFNIGYDYLHFQSGVLTPCPIIYEGEFKGFKEYIREEVNNIIYYAEVYGVPESSICLFMTIQEKEYRWEVRVLMKNVREYRHLLENVIK